MKLFLVHCGFYDADLCDGVYESHANFFVAAENFEDARTRAKLDPVFKGKKMHVDGLQQIDAVDGCRVVLEADPALKGVSRLTSQRHPQLAPKKAPEAS